MKNTLSAIILGIAIVISTVGSVVVFTNYKKEAGDTSSISATGSAEMDFDADLIVWRGSFTATAETSTEAYNKIKNDQVSVREYLLTNGITDMEMIFNSVNIRELTHSNYTDNGNYINSTLDGYKLSQSVVITSKDIDKVEKVSRDISSLLESGVEFESESPEYYCEKLDEVKLELIKLATSNAKERINIMANESGTKLGKLLTSRLGIFQIVARNSGTSNYSYDGYFDTQSRYKTANITVRLEYQTK